MEKDKEGENAKQEYEFRSSLSLPDLCIGEERDYQNKPLCFIVHIRGKMITFKTCYQGFPQNLGSGVFICKVALVNLGQFSIE